MAWARLGDNSATHPLVLRAGHCLRPQDIDLAAPGAELARATLVFGFVVQCATHSASHTTDYWIDGSVPWRMAGPAAAALSAAAQAAGLWSQAERAGVIGWQLLDDPDFIHLITSEQKAWEQRRKQDAANPGLTVPVRRRDGDQCRYCGQLVDWRARRGGRSGTYDHREPGQPATVDTYVVCCRACNSSRKDDPAADARHPLRPPPPDPVYGAVTVEFLAGHGITVPQSSVPTSDPAAGGTPRTQRPGNQPENAPSDPAAGGTPHTTPAPRQRSSAPQDANNTTNNTTSTRPAPPGPATVLQKPADREGAARDGTGRGGIGRAGAGRVGAARAGSGRATDPTTADGPAALLAWCATCQTETEHASHDQHTGTCLSCGTHRATNPPPRPPLAPPARTSRRSRRGGRSGRPRPGGSR